MCKSDFAQFPLREVPAEGKFPVIDYHSFASRFPLPVVPAEGTFPVLDYNKHFSQPPQPVWRAETLPADARDPRGRYCQLFLHLPVYRLRPRQVLNHAVPLTRRQRFEQYVAQVQADHDEHTFWLEYFREKTLEESVISKFLQLDPLAFDKWVLQHDLDEVESKKQRLKDIEKVTNLEYKEAMRLARQGEYDIAAAERGRQKMIAAQDEQWNEEQQQREWQTEEAKVRLATAIAANQQAKGIAKPPPATGLPRLNVSTDSPQQALPKKPEQAEPSATTGIVFEPQKQPSDEVIRKQKEFKDQVAACKRHVLPISSSQTPTPVTTPAGSPKPIRDPKSYEWEKQTLRDILDWLEEPRPKVSQLHFHHWSLRTKKDCRKCYTKMLGGKDWMKARLAEIEAGYTSLVRGFYIPLDTVEEIERGWAWMSDQDWRDSALVTSQVNIAVQASSEQGEGPAADKENQGEREASPITSSSSALETEISAPESTAASSASGLSSDALQMTSSEATTATVIKVACTGRVCAAQ